MVMIVVGDDVEASDVDDDEDNDLLKVVEEYVQTGVVWHEFVNPVQKMVVLHQAEYFKHWETFF